jgi:hypothetical protein
MIENEKKKCEWEWGIDGCGRLCSIPTKLLYINNRYGY